jgi:DHA3 family macrolide efflux protein-like MFS transporter
VLSLLQDQPNFRRFWLGQVVSQLGDRIYSLALLWVVYQWTGSGLAVALVMIATTLPGVLVGPLAGGLADRWNRRWILVVADLCRAALMAATAWAAAVGALSMPWLLVVSALMSVAAAFFNPTAMALLPNLVPQTALTRANAMNQLSANTSGVLGPLVGSGLIAALGVPLAFLANGLSYLWSAAFELIMRLPPGAPVPRQSVWADLREGWRAASGQPLVMGMLGPIVVVNFFFTALVVLVPVLAEGVYDAGAVGLGLLMSAYALGMLAGAVGLSALPVPWGRGAQVVGGTFAMGLAFVVMAAVLVLPATALGLLLVGLTLNVVNINLISLYQEVIPDALRGKVFGLLTALSLSLQPIAYGIMGALIDLFSPQLIFLVSGVVITVNGLALLRLPELRKV